MPRRTNTAVWLEKYGRWQINVQKDGERKTFTCSTLGRNGQRECNKKADEWLDNSLVSPNRRAEELYKLWLAELKATTSRGHWSLYDSYWRNWIKPSIGTKKISAVVEQHLQNIITTAHKSGLSKKTISNLRACMVAFIKYARKSKATQLIPEDLSIPRNAPEGERRILQPEDVVKLFSIDHIGVGRLRTSEIYVNAYRFEVITGLRPGEILGLKWSDIDGETVRLGRSINKYGETTKGKNKNARRQFILTPLAAGIIENEKKKLEQLNIKTEYVFPNAQGENIAQRTYHNRWTKYREMAGISKVTPYELRHTFVSVSKQLPTGLLKMLVGHSKDMDTYGTYSHEIDGDMKLAAEMVQRLFDDILNKKTC